jgi:hypothetical protein
MHRAPSPSTPLRVRAALPAARPATNRTAPNRGLCPSSEALPRPLLCLSHLFLAVLRRRMNLERRDESRRCGCHFLYRLIEYGLFVLDGFEVPLSFRTNWSAEARISSSDAGGSKLASTLMLRHMDAPACPLVRVRMLGDAGWVALRLRRQNMRQEAAAATADVRLRKESSTVPEPLARTCVVAGNAGQAPGVAPLTVTPLHMIVCVHTARPSGGPARAACPGTSSR